MQAGHSVSPFMLEQRFKASNVHCIIFTNKEKEADVSIVLPMHAHYFLKPPLLGSIFSGTRTEVHHTLTPLHTYTDLHLHTENKIASFVISAEPARFCR